MITTSKGLSIRLAQLATEIRKRVNTILWREQPTRGPFGKLMTAFKVALIHDLSEDDFADMYAQTITYGLLSARVSRRAGLVADNITDMVPVTNPFLKGPSRAPSLLLVAVRERSILTKSDQCMWSRLSAKPIWKPSCGTSGTAIRRKIQSFISTSFS